MMSAHAQAENSPAPSATRPQTFRQRDRLRILHVVPCLGIGGTENGVLKVIHGLAGDEFEHGICAVRGIHYGFERGLNNLRTFVAGSSEPGFQFPLFRLTRIMKEFRPHVVHTRNFGALEAIPAARVAGVPVVIHSEHGYELEILRGLPVRRRLMCRSFYAMADAVFTVTEDLRTFHAKQSWLSANHFRVLYNGVDLAKFSPRMDARNELRKSYGVPQGRAVVGSVGRLVPIKDHASLLRASDVLLRRGIDLHVLLVGDGPEFSRLKELAAASRKLAERVTFSGASDRVPDLMAAMDVFVLPSICEGMSNTLLEAMASGLAVVATRTGGNPELVEDGRSGLLFEPRDVNGLAIVLSRLVENEPTRNRLGRLARERATQQFSLAGMIQRYRGLYLDLASRAGVERAG